MSETRKLAAILEELMPLSLRAQTIVLAKGTEA